jgi:hypothetical protein
MGSSLPWNKQSLCESLDVIKQLRMVDYTCDIDSTTTNATRIGKPAVWHDTLSFPLANEQLTVRGTVRDPPSFVSPEADGRAPW